MDTFNEKVERYLSSLTHFHAVPSYRSDICQVCCGPTNTTSDGFRYTTCYKCQEVSRQANAAGEKLANVTAFVTYALQLREKSPDQALHDMYTYKNSIETKVRRDAASARLVGLLYSVLHSFESRRDIGGPFDVVTFVPPSTSAAMVTEESSLSKIIKRTLQHICDVPPVKSTLDWSPNKERVKHQFDLDKFHVTDFDLIRSSRVLLIEDTWVSGANAQCAAAALHRADASWVSTLTIARMLDEDDEKGEYLRSRYHSLPPPTLRYPPIG